MARRTYVEELEDPVTGVLHRVEAQTEAELDRLTQRLLEDEDPVDSIPARDPG